jgi:Ca2+-binding RTX toxin-like protein
MAITGTSGADTLNGTSGSDDFYGYEGDDVMNGGSGDDTFYIAGSSFGIDTFNGGDGTDEIRLYGNVTVSQINFSSAKVSSIETLALGGYAFDGTTGNDSFNLSGIGAISSNRTMNLNDGDDNFIGHAGVNYVNGGSGNDMLDGGAGADELTGAEGNDTLIGGTGDDTFYIAGSSFGIDTFNGGDGADEIRVNGNVSVSQINFSSAKVTSVETLALGGYAFDGTIGNDTFNLSAIGAISSNRTMNLNDGDDNFIGHAGVNYVNGGSGNDRLDGGAGSDELTGAEGNDTLIGGTGDDTFYIAGSSFGIDTFNGGDGDDEIRVNGNVSVSQINFSSAKVTSVETLALGGYAFDGTIGNDTFNLSAIGAISSNRTMNLNDGDDTFVGHVGVNYVNGGSGNDRLDGGAGADELSGGAGNDTLIGGTGDDELYGNEGNDTINGGVGSDYMEGGAGNDIYYVNSGGDRTIEIAGGGTDTVRTSVSLALSDNIERLELQGTANLNGTGNGLANVLVGNSGSNTLNGLAGADTMQGLGGNDRYYVDNSADVIIEKSNEGTADIVLASTHYSLRSGVGIETLSTTNAAGTAALKLGGNSYANTIIGNAGNNVINGGLGADTLTGGAGKDTFMFNTRLGSPNVDTITDFNVADDTIRLENGIFTALSGTGTLTAAQFVKNATGLAQDANDRIIYETDTGKLFYDANGSASGGRIHFATLDKNLALTASDFFIV